MVNKLQIPEALRISRVLEEWKETAISLESAKFNALSGHNLDTDTIREITQKYKTVDRLIKILESKLLRLCAED